MIRVSIRKLLGPPTVIAVLFAVGVGADADDVETRNGIHAIHGRWEYAGDDAEQQRRLAAIEATVRQMSWLIRGIARKRITASTEIHDSYDFRVGEDTVTIFEDGVERPTTSWDGTPHQVTKQWGDPGTLTRTWEDAALRSHFRQPKGEGSETYRVSDDGRTMTVTVIVSSRRLPSDVRYELSYRRADRDNDIGQS
jgi:hypothetical protein